MSLPHLPKKILISLLTGILTIALGILIITGYNQLYFLEETNVTPFSSTLTWITPTPATGCIIAFAFPTRVTCETTARFNHHLTLSDLRPQTTYRLLLLSGTNFGFYTLNHPFIPDQIPSLPNVAYGKVVTTDTNQPISGATIIARTPSGPISTITSTEGTWSMDLRGTIQPDAIIPVSIFYQNYYFDQDVIVVGLHQPAPDFEILTTEVVRSFSEGKQSNTPFVSSFLQI